MLYVVQITPYVDREVLIHRSLSHNNIIGFKEVTLSCICLVFGGLWTRCACWHELCTYKAGTCSELQHVPSSCLDCFMEGAAGSSCPVSGSLEVFQLARIGVFECHSPLHCSGVCEWWGSCRLHEQIRYTI